MFTTGNSAGSATRTSARSIRDGAAHRESSFTGSGLSPGNNASYVTSAEDLATRPEEFMDWAREVKLDPIIKETVPEAAVFNRIRDLQRASKVFPRWCRTPNSSKFGSISTSHYKWRDRLCSALREQKCDLQDDQDLSLPCALAFVFQACCRHAEVFSSNRRRLASKRDMRTHIDCLMGLDGDMPMEYSTGRELRLPATASNKINAANYDFRVAASAFYTDSITDEDLILVHCVTAYAPIGCGENRMKIGIVSALYQKRVLGIQDQFVFGVFQFEEDFLQVVAGIWQFDEIKIYKVGNYSLRDSFSLSQFYLVLRGIKQLASVYLDQLMDSEKALLTAIETNLPANEWAPVERGLSLKLAALEEWDRDERVNAFLEGMRFESCDQK
ncbi:unnamed protein product [Rhizoctonia solani]|uniref:Uncharacterized protein n=1 Tax=Rhizoctonia solani TaxID=456999 RepID=A0A8H3CTT3_9AGAM|nr:unnamed protein product [Rhizoctonia solani]